MFVEEDGGCIVQDASIDRVKYLIFRVVHQTDRTGQDSGHIKGGHNVKAGARAGARARASVVIREAVTGAEAGGNGSPGGGGGKAADP